MSFLSSRSPRSAALFFLLRGWRCGVRLRVTYNLRCREHGKNVRFQFLKRGFSQGHPELFDMVTDDRLPALKQLIELHWDRHGRARNKLSAKSFAFSL